MNTLDIHCFTIATNHKIPGNLLIDQHRLRYKEVIEKEKWRGVNVEFCEDDGMEFDEFDNLATVYIVARNTEKEVIGVTRAYSTMRPYMLSEVFNHLVTHPCIHSPDIYEATRMVVDRTRYPSKQERTPIVNALLVSYLEYARMKGIKAYTGFMLPELWKSTFLRVGWVPKWIGEEQRLPTGEKVRAAIMEVNDKVEQIVRQNTGITKDILIYS